MANQPSALTNLLTRLRLLKAKDAAGVATRGPLSDSLHKAAGVGFVPGRVVYDTVTGQFVQVAAVGTALVHPSKMPEETNG
ncbi:MAG: hypothetical protein ACRD04_06115 [Terriglobales bacterium]